MNDDLRPENAGKAPLGHPVAKGRTTRVRRLPVRYRADSSFLNDLSAQKGPLHRVIKALVAIVVHPDHVVILRKLEVANQSDRRNLGA